MGRRRLEAGATGEGDVRVKDEWAGVNNGWGTDKRIGTRRPVACAAPRATIDKGGLCLLSLSVDIM